MESKTIASKDNPRIKHISKLLKDKEFRYSEGEYVIEGRRAVQDSRDITEVYVSEGTDIQGLSTPKLFVVNKSVYDSISSTENSQGIVAIAKLSLGDASAIKQNGRYVFLDRLQDPGNLGTIVRVTAAFGFDGIIFSKGTVDPFSPKAVRSAAGNLGNIEVIIIESPSDLKTFDVIAADIKGEKLGDFKWPKSFILAIGNEGAGLSDDLVAVSKAAVSIRISSKVESLNAAVSCAILLYDASRFSKQ